MKNFTSFCHPNIATAIQFLGTTNITAHDIMVTTLISSLLPFCRKSLALLPIHPPLPSVSHGRKSWQAQRGQFEKLLLKILLTKGKA
jgi:hypothetical protein